MADLRVVYSGDHEKPRSGTLHLGQDELEYLRDLVQSARPGLCRYGCPSHPACRIGDALLSAFTVARSRTPGEQDADELGDRYERWRVGE